MQKTKFAILRNEDPYDHLLWEKACEAYASQLEYETIDITNSDWLTKIQSYNPSFLLLKPPGKTRLFHNLYIERVAILVFDLGYKTYPSFNEIRIYENKRFFSYWAKAHSIPHPKTYVFYDRKEAIEDTKDIRLPIVGKMNIGASGKGIVFLKSRHDLIQYINKAFREGIRSKTGPKLKQGKIIKRILAKIKNHKELINRLKTYKAILSDKQIGFIILQEYIPHSFEWRVIRIGDSFFAHKKLVTSDKASGSLIKKYENPPIDLLNYVKDLTDRFCFFSQSVDIFEPKEGEFLVNEMQCIFGQSDPYQMLVNGMPGRYRYICNDWVFEKGMFNDNESFNLRVNHILSLIKNQK